MRGECKVECEGVKGHHHAAICPPAECPTRSVSARVECGCKGECKCEYECECDCEGECGYECGYECECRVWV